MEPSHFCHCPRRGTSYVALANGTFCDSVWGFLFLIGVTPWSKDTALIPRAYLLAGEASPTGSLALGGPDPV